MMSNRAAACAVAMAAMSATLLVSRPAAADEKIGLYILYPSPNHHYEKGPLVVTVVWKKGLPMPQDTHQIMVHLRKPGGAVIKFPRIIGYTTAVEINVWPYVSTPGRYYVRARSLSKYLGQWTPWVSFTTAAYRRVSPKKFYPKWKPAPPPVERRLRLRRHGS